MKKVLMFLLLSLSLAGGLTLSACERKSDVGEDAEELGQDLKRDMERGVEDAKDAVDDATD